MKLSRKDAVGLGLVAATSLVLAVHVAPGDHAARHAAVAGGRGGSAASATEGPTFAFMDVNVVPMDGRAVLPRQVVVVEGGVIRDVGPVGVVRPPEGARRVDGGGTMVLIPGLTDAHVHLTAGAERWLPAFLASGVTTVFNLAGERRHLRMRDRVLAGTLLGPTIYTSGPPVHRPRVRTPEDAAAAAEEHARRGYDFIKVRGDLPSETLRALVEAGRTRHLPVVGHAPRNLPLAETLRDGMAALAHAEELIYTGFPDLDAAGIDAVASGMAAAGTWLIPTLTTFSAITRQWGAPQVLEEELETRPELRWVPAVLADAWRRDNPYVRRDPAGRARMREMLAFQKTLVRALQRTGVPMMTGTDAGLPLLAPGTSLLDEIEALHDVGFSAYEALEAATRNPGRFIRTFRDPAASFGTVTVGARADLVLLDGNPLDDITQLRRPAGVMVRGRWYDRAALREILRTVAEGRVADR